MNFAPPTAPDLTEYDDALKAAFAILDDLADEIGADSSQTDETIERLLTDLENSL